MARIQILQLPDEWDGDNSRTPFALILDQAGEGEAEHYAEMTEALRSFKDDIGARAVLVTTTTIDIPANWVHTDGDGVAGAVRIKVEPDLDGFRQQVQAAVDDAQQRVVDALRER